MEGLVWGAFTAGLYGFVEGLATGWIGDTAFGSLVLALTCAVVAVMLQLVSFKRSWFVRRVGQLGCLLGMAIAVADPTAVVAWCFTEDGDAFVCVPWSALLLVLAQLCAVFILWYRFVDVPCRDQWGLTRLETLKRHLWTAAVSSVRVSVYALLGGVVLLLLSAFLLLPMAPFSSWQSVLFALVRVHVFSFSALWCVLAASAASAPPYSARAMLRALAARGAGTELPVAALLEHPDLLYRALVAPIPQTEVEGRELLWKQLPWGVLLPRLLLNLREDDVKAAVVSVRTLYKALLLAPRFDVQGVLVRHETFPKTMSALLQRYSALCAKKPFTSAYLSTPKGLLARPGREYHGVLQAAFAPAAPEPEKSGESALAQECRHAIYSLLGVAELRLLATTLPEKDVLQRFIDGKE